jgi:hypothetical protein
MTLEHILSFVAGCVIGVVIYRLFIKKWLDKWNRKPKSKFHTGVDLALIVLCLGLILAALGWGMVLASAQGQPFTVMMLQCGGEVRFAGSHMANFADEGSAKSWADGQLSSFDIAYIYRPDGPGLFSNLLWIRSDGNCLGDSYRDWSRPQ